MGSGWGQVGLGRFVQGWPHPNLYIYLYLYIETCAALLGVPGVMAKEDCDPEHPHPRGRRRCLLSPKQAPVQEERVWAGIDVWGCTALSCAHRS